MKKITTLVLVVTLTTVLFSCQKEKNLSAPASEKSSGAAANQANAGKIVPIPPVRVPLTLSDWFAVPLSHTDFHSGSQDPYNLFGKYIIKKPLTGTADTDVKLAYVRTSSQGAGSDSYKYYLLPGDVDVRDRFLVNMNFNLTATQFELTVTGIGIIAVMLDPKDFEDCRYRYIVLSKVDYDGLNIDWSNYKAVAIFLNFTP